MGHEKAQNGAKKRLMNRMELRKQRMSVGAPLDTAGTWSWFFAADDADVRRFWPGRSFDPDLHSSAATVAEGKAVLTTVDAEGTEKKCGLNRRELRKQRGEKRLGTGRSIEPGTRKGGSWRGCYGTRSVPTTLGLDRR